MIMILYAGIFVGTMAMPVYMISKTVLEIYNESDKK